MSAGHTGNMPMFRHRASASAVESLTLCSAKGRIRRGDRSPSQLRKGAWLPRSFTLSTTCHAARSRILSE